MESQLTGDMLADMDLKGSNTLTQAGEGGSCDIDYPQCEAYWS